MQNIGLQSSYLSCAFSYEPQKTLKSRTAFYISHIERYHHHHLYSLKQTKNFKLQKDSDDRSFGKNRLEITVLFSYFLYKSRRGHSLTHSMTYCNKLWSTSLYPSSTLYFNKRLIAKKMFNAHCKPLFKNLIFWPYHLKSYLNVKCM